MSTENAAAPESKIDNVKVKAAPSVIAKALEAKRTKKTAEKTAQFFTSGGSKRILAVAAYVTSGGNVTQAGEMLAKLGNGLRRAELKSADTILANKNRIANADKEQTVYSRECVKRYPQLREHKAFGLAVELCEAVKV